MDSMTPKKIQALTELNKSILKDLNRAFVGDENHTHFQLGCLIGSATEKSNRLAKLLEEHKVEE